MARSDPEVRVLRHNATGQFFTASGAWSDDPVDAYNFPTYVSVLEACSMHEVNNATVVIRCDEGEFILPLPQLDP